jgi:TRAP transporter TAXI family solute receptor
MKQSPGSAMAILGALVLALAIASDTFADKSLVFGGGPTGSTFQVIANAIQDYQPVKAVAGFVVKARTSAGSIENLHLTNQGRMQLSTVYSSDVWQGCNGMLPWDTKKYQNVLAVAYLYGIPAQLIIKQGAGIRSVQDLAGKTVGVGDAGFGALACCEQFLKHIGIWDKVNCRVMGYNDAATAFLRNRLDAFWLLTAFPSEAVIRVAQDDAIDLLDLADDAEVSGYFDKYRYITPLTIPAGTYRGVHREVGTFQDSALWVANADVPDQVVYKLLSLIFTDDGLAYMVSQKKTFKDMCIANGIIGIATPMHPGAIRFWKEKGVLR